MFKNCSKRNVVKGDNYKNLLTGEDFTVMNYDGETCTFTDGTEVPSKMLETAFEYQGNDTPLEKAESVEISNGELIVDGKTIETGSYKPEEVVYSYPGAIIIQIASKDGKKHDLVRYRPRSDKFEKLASSFDGLENVYSNEDGTFAYILKKMCEHKKTVDDETVTLQEIEEELFVCHEDELLAEESSSNTGVLFGEAAKVFAEKDNIVFTMLSNIELADMYDDEGYKFYTPIESEKTYITEVVVHTKSFEDGVEYTSRVVTIDVPSTVTDHELVHDGKQNLFVKMDSGICYTYYGHQPRFAMGDKVVQAADKYPHLAKVDCGTVHNTFYLFNDSMEGITIHVEKTNDRGYVTEIHMIK